MGRSATQHHDDSGALLSPGETFPLKTSGLLVTRKQITRFWWTLPQHGQPVYIRDFASRTPVPGSRPPLRRFDGERALLLSVEMQKGRISSDLGEQIGVALAQSGRFAPDLKLDLIAS